MENKTTRLERKLLAHRKSVTAFIFTDDDFTVLENLYEELLDARKIIDRVKEYFESEDESYSYRQYMRLLVENLESENKDNEK